MSPPGAGEQNGHLGLATVHGPGDELQGYLAKCSAGGLSLRRPQTSTDPNVQPHRAPRVASGQQVLAGCAQGSLWEQSPVAQGGALVGVFHGKRLRRRVVSTPSLSTGPRCPWRFGVERCPRTVRVSPLQVGGRAHWLPRLSPCGQTRECLDMYTSSWRAT